MRFLVIRTSVDYPRWWEAFCMARFPGQKTRKETSYKNGDAWNVEESMVDEEEWSWWGADAKPCEQSKTSLRFWLFWLLPPSPPLWVSVSRFPRTKVDGNFVVIVPQWLARWWSNPRNQVAGSGARLEEQSDKRQLTTSRSGPPH